jgi:hypothetical protein
MMLQFIKGLLLPLVCILVDQVPLLPNIPGSLVTRAVIDSSGHFLIGALSWALAIQSHPFRQILKESFAAGCLSSLVDLDHFIQAGSHRLEDAVSLPQRPFLHCSALPLLLLLLMLVGRVVTGNLLRLGLLLFSSLFSHHLRDATRRGLWFIGLPPVPVSYPLYLVLFYLLPFLYIRLMLPPVTFTATHIV